MDEYHGFAKIDLFLNFLYAVLSLLDERTLVSDSQYTRRYRSMDWAYVVL